MKRWAERHEVQPRVLILPCHTAFMETETSTGPALGSAMRFTARTASVAFTVALKTAPKEPSPVNRTGLGGFKAFLSQFRPNSNGFQSTSTLSC